jgi:hypothetical protein
MFLYSIIMVAMIQNMKMDGKYEIFNCNEKANKKR